MTAIISDYSMVKGFHLGNLFIEFGWILKSKLNSDSLWGSEWVTDKVKSWDPLDLMTAIISENC